MSKDFSRTDAHKKKKLSNTWRRPKGLQNKRRLRKKGYAPVVKVGRQTNKATKGQSKKGFKMVMIKSLAELNAVDKKTECVIISSSIGNRNRLLILEQAKKQDILILNFDVDKAINAIKEKLAAKKDKKEKTIAKKEASKKEAKAKDKKKEEKEKKKAEDKKEKSDSEEDTKEVKEKKEFDKLLTKKQ